MTYQPPKNNIGWQSAHTMVIIRKQNVIYWYSLSNIEHGSK
jgi:hypothetical protein